MNIPCKLEAGFTLPRHSAWPVERARNWCAHCAGNLASLPALTSYTKALTRRPIVCPLSVRSYPPLALSSPNKVAQACIQTIIRPPDVRLHLPARVFPNGEIAFESA